VENHATDPLTVQPVNRRYTYYHSSSTTLSQPSGNFVIDASNPWMKAIMTVEWIPVYQLLISVRLNTRGFVFARLRKTVP
jgi:hypothetical protein